MLSKYLRHRFSFIIFLFEQYCSNVSLRLKRDVCIGGQKIVIGLLVVQQRARKHIIAASINCIPEQYYFIHYKHFELLEIVVCITSEESDSLVRHLL